MNYKQNAKIMLLSDVISQVYTVHVHVQGISK